MQKTSNIISLLSFNFSKYLSTMGLGAICIITVNYKYHVYQFRYVHFWITWGRRIRTLAQPKYNQEQSLAHRRKIWQKIHTTQGASLWNLSEPQVPDIAFRRRDHCLRGELHRHCCANFTFKRFSALQYALASDYWQSCLSKRKT